MARLARPDLGREEVDRLFDGYELVVPGRYNAVFAFGGERLFAGKRVIGLRAFVSGLQTNLAGMKDDERETRAMGERILEVAVFAQHHDLALRFNY